MSTWHTRHQEYLKTEHWTELRKQCINRSNRICEACRSTKHLEGHHLRYREPLESCTIDDVMTLCRRCHGFWHEQIKANGQKLEDFTRETTVSGLRSTLAKLPKGKRRNKKQKKWKQQPPPSPSRYQIPPQYNDKFAILERVVFQQASDIMLLKQKISELETRLK